LQLFFCLPCTAACGRLHIVERVVDWEAALTYEKEKGSSLQANPQSPYLR